MTSVQTWTEAAVAELSALGNPDGGWGYAAGAQSSTEATAICVLALSAQAPNSSAIAPGLAFLEQRRLPEGAFSLSASVPEPSWATCFAAMAQARAGLEELVRTTVHFLLTAPVFVLRPVPPHYGYDTGLAGWPWTAGDYSFVEPTSAALTLLKQQGQGEHARAREAVALVLDRSLPTGGWNYGETVVLGNTLSPAIVPTAMALIALADEPSDATTAGLNWLAGQQGAITSLFSLGWASVALNRWGLLSENWIAGVIDCWSACPPQRRTAMDTALCLAGLFQGGDHPFAIPSGL